MQQHTLAQFKFERPSATHPIVQRWKCEFAVSISNLQKGPQIVVVVGRWLEISAGTTASIREMAIQATCSLEKMTE
jgi:hypothetical protein